MKKEFTGLDGATAFIQTLTEEKKWAISLGQKRDLSYVVQWIEHKMYTAHDGKEFFDEVWTTVDGEMKLIQDLEPEHARNVLRLLLRNERESMVALEDSLAQLADQLTKVATDDDGELGTYVRDEAVTLH